MRINDLQPIKSRPPRDGFTPFVGGLDTETPGWLARQGRLRSSLNYEISLANGYQDITGYERFDGRPKPSDASFTVLDMSDTSSINLGDVLIGASSGATGVVIAIDVYPDDPDQGYVVVTKVTGTFLAENLGTEAASFDSDSFDTNSFSTLAFSFETGGPSTSITDTPYSDSAATAKLKAQYKNLAADEYRDDIGVVPGDGPVWGGFSLGDDKYAIRNKIGGLTAAMYKASAIGWVEVDLGREIAFTSGGVTEILENSSVLGSSSGAIAIVRRVQLISGSWAGGDAAGFLTLVGQIGAFTAENLTFLGDPDAATVAGNSTAIVLQPDGKLDYVKSNFVDTQGPDRVYGADSANYGWEFGGDSLTFIRTGMDSDKPRHVAVHKSKLFFSFGASLQHSADGDPLDWEVILGAAELACRAPITGFQVQPGSQGGGALLVATANQFHILYGNDIDDWNLVDYREKLGGYEWTLQSLSRTIFVSDGGITDLATAQSYGNFAHTDLSQLVHSIINAKRALSIGSCAVRDKSQYRLFFSDKTAIYATFLGPKLLGMMPIELGHQPSILWAEPNLAGKEEVFFGADDGFVYQMERGTSFDGNNIYAAMQLHFDPQKAIEYVKEYFAPVTLEGKSSGYAEFRLSYQLDYGSRDVPQPDFQTAVLELEQAFTWDSGIAWDTFVTWDDTAIVPSAGLDLRGEGRNISWTIVKDSDYFNPLLLSGVHYFYLVKQRIGG